MARILLLLVVLLILSIFIAAFIGAVMVTISKRNAQPARSVSPYRNEPSWESVGAAFALTAIDGPSPKSDAFAGTIGGYPVRLVRIRPWWATDSITYKTEIATYFARPPQQQFIVHGKGPYLRGDFFPTGDPSFDDEFVVRSDAGPTVLPLFDHTARAAIAAYNSSVPSLGLSNKGVEVLIEGAIPPLVAIGDILRAQAHVIAAIEASGSNSNPC